MGLAGSSVFVCVCAPMRACLYQLWQELGKPLGAPPIVPSVDSFVDSVMVRGASVAILTPAQPIERHTQKRTLRSAFKRLQCIAAEPPAHVNPQ